MEAGAYIAGGPSACVTILFIMGNRVSRIALVVLVLVLLGGYALYLALASGMLAHLVERSARRLETTVARAGGAPSARQ